MEKIKNSAKAEIKKAAHSLMDGYLVAFPTETVYGLGADAANEKAVSRIYDVKGRPANHPLIVHISSINKLEKWAVDVPEYAIKLAKEFWPGPLTLILNRNKIAKDFITGGQDKVGLRVPNQITALLLLQEFEKLGGLGVAAPSANKFGAVSPTCAEAVIDELGGVMDSKDLILDGGKCEIGIESTIVDCTQEHPRILRPGWVTKNMIEESSDKKVSPRLETEQIRVPGQLEKHYKPKARIQLGFPNEVNVGFIALSNFKTPDSVIRLASPKDSHSYASELYAAFRLGDAQGLSKIFVIAPEGDGIAVAIRDRLVRCVTY
jgi:L-threonylcarbamoyladenylate synthase